MIKYLDIHTRDLELDLISRISALEIQMDAVVESQKEDSAKLDTILKETARYKGFVGGVLFICACLAAFVKIAISSYLVKH